MSQIDGLIENKNLHFQCQMNGVMMGQERL